MSETSRELTLRINAMFPRSDGRVLTDIEALIESHTNQAVREADQKWIDAFGAQDLEPRVTPESLAKWVFRDVEQQLNGLKAEFAAAERRGREEAAKHYITYRGIDYVNCVCGMMLPTRSILVSEAWAQHIIALDPQGKPDTPEGTK